MIKFAPGNKVASVWKHGNDIACFIQRGIATGVIKMEVGIDNDSYAFRLYTNNRSYRLRQRPLPRDAKHRNVFGRPLLSDTGLDQYSLTTSIYEHAIHVHPNPVLFIRWTNLRPERAGDNSKHGAAIEAKLSVRNNLHAVIAKLHFGFVAPQSPYFFFFESAFGLGAFWTGSTGAGWPDCSFPGANSGGAPCG